MHFQLQFASVNFREFFLFSFLFLRNTADCLDESLVSAKIVQKADGSLEVDASVSSISIIISVEFLLKLATFFTEALPLPPPSEAAVKIGNHLRLHKVGKTLVKWCSAPCVWTCRYQVFHSRIRGVHDISSPVFLWWQRREFNLFDDFFERVS